MRYNQILKKLDRELGSKITSRRYNLSDMISESYKSLYQCEAGTNLHKLVESHLDDVRKNPKDIDRLSRQLCIVNEVIRMTESNQLKDEDLVPKKSYDTVEPNKNRSLGIEEAKESDKYQSKYKKGKFSYYVDKGDQTRVYDDDGNIQGIFPSEETAEDTGYELTDESTKPRKLKRATENKDCDKEEVIQENLEGYTWGDWQSERGSSVKVKFYSNSQDMTDQIIGVVYDKDERDLYGAEIYDNSIAATITDIQEFETEEDAIEFVEDWFINNLTESNGEDTELTDEELEELTKHLEEYRKKNKVKECNTNKSVGESIKPRRLKRVKESKKKDLTEDRDPDYKLYNMIMDSISEALYSVFESNGLDPEDDHLMQDFYYAVDIDNLVYDTAKFIEDRSSREVKESTSYRGLSNFKKLSESKAFYKTFKKLDTKLREGTSLTRQESIDLYKASNSALTQLSIELEHNPEFLDTFKESVSLLSVDVNSLLNSLKEGKSPSKKTMKSLAKFSEALLLEDKVFYPNGEECRDDSVDMDKALDYQYGTDRDKDNSKYTTEEKQRALNYWIEKTDSNINEDEEEDLPPIEDEENEFISDEEGSIDSEESEESEEFDQEYADARVELHKQLVDKYADNDDPVVQQKLAQDSEEVTSLPGITDEQIAELQGEDSPEETDDEEEEDMEENEDEITDDELAELKKHLQEMRKVKRAKK